MRILLGICGGIAAYKTPDLVRRLADHGHEVRCVLTANAERLVAIDALRAVSGADVATELWPRHGDMPHITLARWAEHLLIAPITAHTIARCALSLADDLLTTLYLALDPAIPISLAPAMNTTMWHKPIVQQHLATLQANGCDIIAPVAGQLACGEEGAGKMAEPLDIARYLSGSGSAGSASTSVAPSDCDHRD